METRESLELKVKNEELEKGKQVMGRIKAYIALGVLLAYVLASAGCAVVWFLAGAGTAATAITVAEDQKKAKAK